MSKSHNPHLIKDAEIHANAVNFSVNSSENSNAVNSSVNSSVNSNTVNLGENSHANATNSSSVNLDGVNSSKNSHANATNSSSVNSSSFSQAESYANSSENSSVNSHTNAVNSSVNLNAINSSTSLNLAPFNARLNELEKALPLKAEKSIPQALSEAGFSRRDFLKWSAAMTAFMALPSAFAPVVARAAELADRLPVVWLHMAECTGCSESLLRSDTPTIDSLIFDHISLEYHETVMSASGWQAEQNLEHAIAKHKGKYALMVEGGIPMGATENYLTIGALGKTGRQIAEEACNNAAVILAIGTCSSFGGIQAARPNPSNAHPLHDITNKEVINVPGCPPSEKNIVGNVLQFLLFGEKPALDVYNRPKWAYGLRIHDLCERRGHFDAGEFVQEFGDEGAKKGYCLYKVGCKGPYTFNNCSRERFNSHTSWPIQAGHGCIGCSEPHFWDNMQPFESPMASHKFDSVFGGLGADAVADKIGIGVLCLTGVAIAAHAAIAAVKKTEE